MVAATELEARHATSRAPTATRLAPRLTLAAMIIVGLAVRWAFLDVQSADYTSFLVPWFTHLLQAGGLPGLADVSSNYNSPYLVLLALLSYLPVSSLVSIKALSVAFDLLLAFWAYKIARAVGPRSRWAPALAAGAVFLLPTVIMNSGVWGQCDSIYASFALGSLYFLITRRPWRACLFFGLALAFKLQAVFLLPVLLGVLMINKLRFRALLAIPVVLLAALLPALAFGRSLVTQLLVYPAQMGITGSDGDPARSNNGGGRGGGFGGGGGGNPGRGGGFGGGGQTATFDPGTGHAHTYNAPTWYAWLPSEASAVWTYVGLGLATLVAVLFAVVLIRRRRSLSPAEILLVAATSTLVIPLLLPEMHERYFYLAEVLTVVAVVVDRRLLLPAAAIQFATVTTYLAYLRRTEYVSLEVAAAVALVGAVLAAVVLLLRLRRRVDDDGRVGTVSPAPSPG